VLDDEELIDRLITCYRTGLTTFCSSLRINLDLRRWISLTAIEFRISGVIPDKTSQVITLMTCTTSKTPRSPIYVFFDEI